MRSMKIVLHGQPINQARPRFSRRGGIVLTFDPRSKEKAQAKKEIEAQLIKAINSKNREIAIEASRIAVADFYSVSLSFHMSVPKSSTDVERSGKLWGLRKHAGKPDLDNLEKFYLDCLTDLIFQDDSKVINLSSKKLYSNNPRTEINVKGHQYSLSNDVNGILESFGPDKLHDFMTIAWELFDLYGRDEEGDWVEEAVGGDVDHVRLARTAYLLSALAEKTHKPFSKIHRQFPDFYLKAERLADTLKNNGLS